MDPDLRQELLDGIARSQASTDQLVAEVRQSEAMQSALITAAEGITELAATMRAAGLPRETAFGSLAGYLMSTTDLLVRTLWDQPPPFRGQMRGH